MGTKAGLNARLLPGPLVERGLEIETVDAAVRKELDHLDLAGRALHGCGGLQTDEVGAFLWRHALGQRGCERQATGGGHSGGAGGQQGAGKIATLHGFELLG